MKKRQKLQETTEETFLRFHEQNPDILEICTEICSELKHQHKFKKCSIALVFERLRWIYLTGKRSGAFKISNNHKPFYARLLMQVHPEFKGFFELHQQWAAKRPAKEPPTTEIDAHPTNLLVILKLRDVLRDYVNDPSQERQLNLAKHILDSLDNHYYQEVDSLFVFVKNNYDGTQYKTLYDTVIEATFQRRDMLSSRQVFIDEASLKRRIPKLFKRQNQGEHHAR